MTPRLLGMIAGVGFVVGAIVGIVQYAVSSPECEPLGEVPWTAARLDEIGASVGRAGKAEVWPATRAAIEAFAGRWDAAYVKACEVPEGPPRDAAYACLAESYTHASALLDELKLLDPEALATAQEAVGGFTAPEACVD